MKRVNRLQSLQQTPRDVSVLIEESIELKLWKKSNNVFTTILLKGITIDYSDNLDRTLGELIDFDTRDNKLMGVEV